MARKVNKKFLIILVTASVLVVGGGTVAYVFRDSILRPPSRILGKARNFEQQGEMLEAARHYAWAAQKLKSPQYYTKAADIFDTLTSEDDENVRYAVQFWRLAVQTDPGYLPALEKLLAIGQESLEMSFGNPDPATIEQIKDTADKILKVQPDHPQAKLAVPSAVMRGWLMGIETPSATIDDSLKTLMEALSADPKNSDLAMLVAQAMQRQSRDLRNQGLVAEATAREDESVKLLEDLIAAQPDNAGLHYRLAQLVVRYYSADTESPRGKAFFEKFKSELQRSREIAKPDHPDYLDIMHSTGGFLMRDGQTQQAEAVYRDLLENLPNDPNVRVIVGEFMGASPRLRDEGIAVLEGTYTPTEDSTRGLRGTLLPGIQMRAALSAAALKLDKYAASTDPAEKEKLLAEVQAAHDKAIGRFKDSPLALRVRGKLELFTGKPVEATQTLSKAMAETPREDVGSYELKYLLANAYIQTQQMGDARRLLDEIVTAIPSYLPAKIQLATLLVQQKEMEQAGKLVDELQKAAPDDPRVNRLVILMRESSGQKGGTETAEAYAKLPEKTRDQKVQKAAIAAATKNPDAIRLIDLLLAENPKDVEAILGRVAWLELSQNDKAGAIAFLETKLPLVGQDPRVIVQMARLKGQPIPRDLPMMTPEAAQNMTPSQKEFTLALQAAQASDEKAFLTHLQEAERLDPKNAVVLDRAFVYYLSQRDWTKCEEYARKLGDLNVDMVKGNLYRWRLLMAQGELDKAAEQAAMLTRDYGDFAQSWLSLGDTHFAMRKLQDALVCYNTALQKQPNNPDIYMGLIRTTEALGQPQEMKKHIDRAVKVTSAPQFIEQQKQWEMRYGDPEQIIPAREAAVAAKPDVASNWRQLGLAYTTAGFARRDKKNDVAGSKQFFMKARDTYTKALEKFPDDDSIAIPLANQYALLGDKDSAEKVLLAFAARPAWKDKPQTRSMLFDWYVQAGKPQQAEAIVREGLAVADDKNLRGKLQELLVQQKRFDDALATVPEGNDPVNLKRRAEILLLAERYEPAKALVQQLASAGETPDLLGLIGYIEFKQRNFDASLKTFDRVLAADPANEMASYHRALILAATPGKLEDAIREATRLKTANPSNLKVRYLLAECNKRNRDFEGEYRELEEIIQRDPGQKDARLRLMNAYNSADPPRYSDAERIGRDAHTHPSLVNDADIFAAEAQTFTNRGDYKKAAEKITAGIQAAPGSMRLIQQYFDILRRAKNYQGLLTAIGKLSAEAQRVWWVRLNKAVAMVRTGDRAGGLAEFDAALQATVDANDFSASEGVVMFLAEELSPDVALKQIDKNLQKGASWKLLAVRLNQQKADMATARRLCDEVLADPTLTPENRLVALGHGGSVYQLPPDADFPKSRDMFLELLKSRPDDIATLNNLACNPSLDPQEALKYSTKAYELLLAQSIVEPAILDTHGWNLVQSGKVSDGLAILTEAWGSRQFAELAYHIGEGYLRIEVAEADRPAMLAESEKFLKTAMEMFNKDVADGKLTDAGLQKRIIDARARLDQAKNK